MQQTPEKPVAKEVLQLLDHTPPTSKTSCRTGCPCPAPRTFAWDDHNHTANTSKRKTRHSAASITSSFEVGALQQALVHQRGQLKDAKAIIRQQGKELREKDTDFEALKEHPDLSEQQEDFLMRQYHTPGKLPSAAIHRAMGVLFPPREVLKAKRIKSWISRYTAMLKKKSFTASIRAAQQRLQEELGDGGCADIVRDLGGGEEEEGVGAEGGEEGGEEEQSGSDEEETEEAAPAPKHGYQHCLEAPLGTQSLVGMRLTYRFRSDEGWLDGVIRSKCTSSGVGQR